MTQGADTKPQQMDRGGLVTGRKKAEKVQQKNKHMFDRDFRYTGKRIVSIVAGTCLFAMAVQWVYDPCGMVVGGFSGIAIMVKELTGSVMEGGIPLGLTTLVLNIPLFLAALPVKGVSFLIRTVAATLLVSFWLTVLPVFPLLGEDLVLAALFGGVLSGTGIGLVISAKATTGGTDMLASLLQQLFPTYSIGQLMFVLDGIIILAGAMLFGIKLALYAVISVYVASKLSDALVVGTHYAKSVYIITEHPRRVAQAVFERVDRGVTGLSGRGMYTDAEKLVLFCVVAKKEIVRLKECVYQEDPDAFVIVSEAQEVHGEGFHHQIVQKKIG